MQKLTAGKVCCVHPTRMAASRERRSVERFFDAIGGVPGLLLRLSLMLTTPSFVSLVALEERYTDCRYAGKGLARPSRKPPLAAGGVRCLGSTCRRSVGPNPPLVTRRRHPGFCSITATGKSHPVAQRENDTINALVTGNLRVELSHRHWVHMALIRVSNRPCCNMLSSTIKPPGRTSRRALS
jgi:hypothetical protein